MNMLINKLHDSFGLVVAFYDQNECKWVFNKEVDDLFIEGAIALNDEEFMKRLESL